MVNREGIIKLSLSLALLAYAGIIAIYTKNIVVFFAMAFSTVGDIFIMSSRGVFRTIREEKREECFEFGVVAFAVAHCTYVYIMTTTISKQLTIANCILYVAICIFSSIQKTRKRKVYFVPYAMCLLINAVNSWLFSPIAGIGMILFLASDGILSIFEKRSSKWQIAIWATYVPAQIMLLTAILLSK